MTGRDLISASLRLLGVLASGESLGAAEATDGLTALNQLIDSWSTENLLIPNKVREVFTLIPLQQSYTIGPTGDFVTTRPMRIEKALIRLSSTAPSTELPMKLITEDEFAGIIVKDVTSSLPTYLYAEGTYPLETINLWPIPSVAYQLVTYSWKQLAQLALDVAISLPPGYERALKYSLAIELAPEYGRPIADSVAMNAVEAKAAIKRMNARPKYLQVDDALRARPAVWNWMTGEPT